jgi:hypothetical protein
MVTAMASFGECMSWLFSYGVGALGVEGWDEPTARVFANRIRRLIKLGLSIEDTGAEDAPADLDDLPPLEAEGEDESRMEEVD